MVKHTLTVILVFAIGLIGCRGPAIEGRILDGFGKPVVDATVSIAGTQFVSLTNQRGEYSVRYVPGSIKVIIAKQGFTDTSFVVTIATESRFPAAPVIIYEIPKASGIFVMDHGAYTPLSKVLVTQRTARTVEFWQSSETTTFMARLDDDANKLLTLITQDTAFVFFDNDPSNQWLYKVTEEEGTFLTRIVKNGAMGFAVGDYRDLAQNPAETIRLFMNVLALRSSKLEVGDYVFANYNSRSRTPIQGDVYAFRVVTPEEREQRAHRSPVIGTWSLQTMDGVPLAAKSWNSVLNLQGSGKWNKKTYERSDAGVEQLIESYGGTYTVDTTEVTLLHPVYGGKDKKQIEMRKLAFGKFIDNTLTLRVRFLDADPFEVWVLRRQ